MPEILLSLILGFFPFNNLNHEWWHKDICSTILKSVMDILVCALVVNKYIKTIFDSESIESGVELYSYRMASLNI